MAEFEIVQADVMEWCEEYDGPPFHALLTDAPFHLTPNDGGLVECSQCGAKMARRYRFCHQCGAEMDTEAAKSGFMSKKWDGGILAFQPELWQALARHLYPGAFIFSYASSRGYHRLAVALEDAGMVYQPDVFVEGVGVVDCAGFLLHVQAQSFPKATKLDKIIDRRAGKLGERRVIGQRISGRMGTRADRRNANEGFERGEMLIDIELPATPLAQAWAGHRYGGQILRDCATPVVVAQKPWQGRRLDCIVETGAGSLWVEGARVATGGESTARPNGVTALGQGSGWNSHSNKPGTGGGNTSGRWPPNYAVSHFSRTLPDNTIWGCIPITETRPCPDCSGDDGNGRGCERCKGEGVVEVEAVERVKGSHSMGNCQGKHYSDEGGMFGANNRAGYHHVGDDNREPVRRYACARHCPGCGWWWRSEKASECPDCGEEGEWACSVRRLGEDSGSLGNSYRPSGCRGGKLKFRGIYNAGETGGVSRANVGYKGIGTAARYYPNPSFSHETAEALALGDVRKYQAKPSPREKSAGLERFVWRKQKHGHTRVWSDAAIDEFHRWQEERKGLPGKGFDEWLEACGESKRKIHRIPYTWGNIHPTVKSIALNRWLATLLLPPDIYAPRRLLIPFCGTFSEGAGAALAGWEHITGIDSDEQTCWQAEARAKFWHGWSERTGEREPKAILKTYRKAKKAEERAAAKVTQQEPQQLALEVGA